MSEPRPYRYQGKIRFDVPGVNFPTEAGFASGGAGAKGSTPYGDWPITQFNPHTPKYDLQGFALNNIYGRLPDPQASDGQRSDIMLHLDPKGRTLDKIKSLGCLSVAPEDWPALRDEIISLQKQGYSLVAHVDNTGQVTIRQSDGTTATPVASASAFADATKAARAPIRDLQSSLAKAGFDPGKVDGIQGPQTTAAVKAFQQANGLKADGIVGPMTSTVLAASGGTGKPANGVPPLPLPRPRPPQGADSLGAQAGSRSPGAMANTTTLGWDPQYGHTIAGETIRGSLPAADYARARLTAANVPPITSSFGLPLIPKPAPITAPTVNEAMREQMQARAVQPMVPVPMPGRPTALSAASTAPALMPGRPAALSAAPPAPVQAQPPQLPAQRPSAPVAPPQPAPVQLRLASGKTIAPGVYTQPDGHSVQVSDAGDGTARITQIHGIGSIPGVLDPMREMNAPTIAGGMIRKMLPTALGNNASAFVPTLANNVKSAAANAAGNLGGALSGFGGGILGGLGGLFGQHPTLPHPFNLLGGALQQQAPQPMNRPAVFSMPQQQAPQHQTYQQAQNDLRDSGMIDQFGMIRM